MKRQRRDLSAISNQDLAGHFEASSSAHGAWIQSMSNLFANTRLSGNSWADWRRSSASRGSSTGCSTKIRMDRVGMIVTQLTLDSRTARIATRQDVYVYQR
jgi:hypothetical protein